MDRTVLRPGSAGEHLLQHQLDTVERADRFYANQVLDHLNERMREFVGRQEMMFVGSADGQGECDTSFRAGPPGFIQVLDDSTLAWPEYRGNGVMATLGNVSDNAHVGLLLVDFFVDLIGLHVNGAAEIVEDSELRADHPYLPTDTVPGRRPELWVVVTVQEAYIHCAKHIPRLVKVPRTRAWGSDSTRRKGGDYFEARQAPSPWGSVPPEDQPGEGPRRERPEGPGGGAADARRAADTSAAPEGRHWWSLRRH